MLRLELVTFSQNRLPALFWVSVFLSWMAFSLSPSQTVFAADVFAEQPPVQNLEGLQNSGALNGILCEPDCGRFFEDGHESFEEEIQRLENRLSHVDESVMLLQIDPVLKEPTKPWPQELE